MVCSSLGSFYIVDSRRGCVHPRCKREAKSTRAPATDKFFCFKKVAPALIVCFNLTTLTPRLTANVKQEVLVRRFGVTQKQALRSQALLRLGVTEQDVRIAERLIGSRRDGADDVG